MEEKTNQITDHSIWDILGLDLTDQDKKDMIDDFMNAAWMDLTENGLREVLGEEKYSKLYAKLKDKNYSKEEFIQAVKDELTVMSVDVEAEYQKSMVKVLKEFVQDQVNYLEKRVKGVKDQTERDVKLSLIKTLWDMFSSEQWDQMGAIFRKIDGYQLPEGLVLHL